jgi:hypothetical protein
MKLPLIPILESEIRYAQFGTTRGGSFAGTG